MYRVEDKYTMPRSDFLLLEKNIKSVLPLDTNQKYKISSIYFDDMYDTDLMDTINGNPTRKKMRIRIYNDSFKTIKLEVKYKIYSRIHKESCNITKQEMSSLINGIPIEWSSVDSPRNLFNEKILSSNLKPKVIVAYDRSAYLYNSGNTRITFDSNVRSSNQTELFGNKDLYYDSIDDLNYILEVKYDEFMPDFISYLCSTNNMMQISYSKYFVCRDNYRY
jgi:hypothetical protein